MSQCLSDIKALTSGGSEEERRVRTSWRPGGIGTSEGITTPSNSKLKKSFSRDPGSRCEQTDDVPCPRYHSFMGHISRWTGQQSHCPLGQTSPNKFLLSPIRQGVSFFWLAGLLHLSLYLCLCHVLPLKWCLWRTGPCYACQDRVPESLPFVAEVRDLDSRIQLLLLVFRML